MINYGSQTIVFDEVYIHGEKVGKCGCGVRRVRREKFSQTINPYNLKKDGAPKQKRDIMPELVAERDAWKKEPITCAKCKSSQ